ncbi:Flp pilus assembly protein CpaB [Adlercreutzia sp. R25]|uniref:Flp pilus assembly protein CpaB n=1 Tax=Adlercreutzia shanghongiae TaxID=3111773 RepID=A0ABU6IZY5_9ACTN|nr:MULTISPECIES: Flp pilus assembly protein CpaB [unclassified Adlercreutzia]MEC4273132.1 Flp pilus assembly protein CpaB [Adlercreutzia sp. R25]MEC4295383.1 Flp pilus assembly protein CpaB [Adlercreutzia sp. R22]
MAINKTKWGAAACGLCCALCVALYLGSVRGEVDAARAEALERYGGDQIEVCVAKRDLAAGEVVDASSLATKMWVADLLPDGAVTDASQIVGQRLGSSIIKGEVICARRMEASDSSLSVPEGMAAISVPAQAIQAVGGSIEPGMEVDVYATGPVSTTKLVSAALVLASSATSESGATVDWITLAVAPERVQEVVAAAQNLELYFALPAVSVEGSADASEATAGEQGQETTVEEDQAVQQDPSGDASATSAPGVIEEPGRTAGPGEAVAS